MTSLRWWPYGDAAEALARAVLGGDPVSTRLLAQNIIDEADRVERFVVIERVFNDAVEACRWDECWKLIDQMKQIVIWDTSTVVGYEWMVHLEAGDGISILDRIVSGNNDVQEEPGVLR